MANLILPDTAAANDPEHIEDHNKIVTAIGTVNTALEAVETELGTNPSGTEATVAARIAALEVGGANRDRLYTAATVHPQNDEFNGATLDPAWTRVDIAGTAGRMIWTQGAGVLSLRVLGTDAAAEFHGLVKPYALAIGEGVQAGIRTLVRTTHVLGGPCVSDGVTTTGGKMLTSAQHSPNTWSIRTINNWNTQVNDYGNAAIATIMNPIGHHHKLMRTGASTWEMSISPDGVTWLPWTSGTWVMTPTHVGFAWSSWQGANTGIATMDYFRIVTS